MINTKLQSCHCEERSDVAIYPIEPALPVPRPRRDREVRVAGNKLLALQYFGNRSPKNQAWQISLPWRHLAGTL